MSRVPDFSDVPFAVNPGQSGPDGDAESWLTPEGIEVDSGYGPGDLEGLDHDIGAHTPLRIGHDPRDLLHDPVVLRHDAVLDRVDGIVAVEWVRVFFHNDAGAVGV